MNEERVRELLEKAKALVTDRHFVYSRPKDHGDHGGVYIDKDACFWDPDILMELAEGISLRFRGCGVQVVAGPAYGAIGLAGFVAYQHSAPHHASAEGCNACFLIKDGNSTTGFSLRSAFKVAGKRVLVVEDIINSGGSARDTVATLRAAGAEVIGLSCLANRGQETAASLGVPVFEPLISFEFSKMSEQDCLDHGLCAKGVPIETALGHGKAFLARQAKKKRLESEIAGG